MMWRLSRPPLTRPMTPLTAFLAVLTVLATGVKSSPPATGPAPVPPPTDRQFEIRTLTPAAPQPTAYPAIIEFELVNRSTDTADVGGVRLWDFDLDIAAADSPPKKRPLENAPMDRSGLIHPIQLAPGESHTYTAFIGVLKPGVYRVRVFGVHAGVDDVTELPTRGIASEFVSDTTATVLIDDLPATRDRWVADASARLERFDGYVARQALLRKITPLRDKLLAMLGDVQTGRAAFAARVFRSVWRPTPEPDLDQALGQALAACDALPMAKRTEAVDGALLNLVQEIARPEWLDQVIRWSRPGGSKSRDSALLALQAYRSDPKAIEAVAALLNDDNHALFAAELLCDWRRDERALPVLIKHAFMTEGRTSQPFIYFHQLIKYGRHPQVVAACERGLKDPRPEVAAEARAALAKLTPDPVPVPVPVRPEGGAGWRQQ